jgi:hypothetical protein
MLHTCSIHHYLYEHIVFRIFGTLKYHFRIFKLKGSSELRLEMHFPSYSGQFVTLVLTVYNYKNVPVSSIKMLLVAVTCQDMSCWARASRGLRLCVLTIK